jgi:hypothetical protein
MIRKYLIEVLLPTLKFLLREENDKYLGFS